MANIQPSGTLTSGNSGEIPITRDRVPAHQLIQVDTRDTGTLTVGTKVSGQSAFTTQTTVVAGTIILDMFDVVEVQLAAAGGDSDYVVSVQEQESLT